MRRRLLCLPVALLALLLAARPARLSDASHPRPLVTGWHDEFNRLDDWAPWTGGSYDVLRGGIGRLTVVLGKSSMYMPVFKHFRAGAYRDIDVDLDHYPVLAVRALRTHDIGQWDVQVFQYRDPGAPDARDISHGGGVPVPGNAAALAADTVAESKGHTGPAIVFVEATPLPSARAERHVRLMLNVSGPARQGYVDFAWVPFIRREDVVRLRRHPDLADVRGPE